MKYRADCSAGDALEASCEEKCVRDLPGLDGGHVKRVMRSSMVQKLFGEGGHFGFAAPGDADGDVEDYGIH